MVSARPGTIKHCDSPGLPLGRSRVAQFQFWVRFFFVPESSLVASGDILFVHAGMFRLDVKDLIPLAGTSEVN